MKKRFIFPVLLAVLSLTACDFTLFSVEKNEGEKEVEVDPATLEAYYQGCDLTKTGGRLLVELQKHSFEKHKVWIKYGQINSYYSTTTNRNSTEAIADGSKVNEWYYTGKQKAGTSGSNREHVWPCANSSGLWTHDKPTSGNFSPFYVDNSNYVGGGSDLYHVRLCESDVNTARGNSRFVSFDDPEYQDYKSSAVEVGENEGKYVIKVYGASESNGKWTFANKTEVDDHMKGDVARLVLYVWMHYTDRGVTPSGSVKSGTNTFNYSDMTGSLNLSSVMGYDDEERCLEVLKAWNKLDAPSNVEKLRNQTVQKIQGNRNPFVDHPELVDAL